MITKNDCLSILVKLEDEGNVEAKGFIKKLFMSKEIPVEALKFIAENRGFEVANFYEVLRKSHNKNKSPLYTNILKDVSSITAEEVITTLSCLLTQIVLYGNKIENKDAFYKAARATEVLAALNEYFVTGSIALCIKLLRVVKADLLVLEYLAGKREAVDSQN